MILGICILLSIAALNVMEHRWKEEQIDNLKSINKIITNQNREYYNKFTDRETENEILKKELLDKDDLLDAAMADITNLKRRQNG